ncbi:MAG: QVPTGV class sortase B protein-sorting domain-containing protein [Oscillospiraceae bacterium]|nr:QVPTGV class sortase B protein-sorting domain-containing protein [Oscillospiraceae bacterium]
MQKKKMFKRIAAVALAAAMSVSVFAISASAIDKDTSVKPEKSFKITKIVDKADNVYAPKTTFNFTIEPAAAIDSLTNPIYKGVEGGVAKSAAISFDPETDGYTAQKDATIAINAKAFTGPGIYRYAVKETAGNYDGITYDATTKYLDVYVDNTGVVYDVAFEGKTTDKDNGVFTNEYKTGNGVNDLIVKKTVTGGQGDLNKDFHFTVTVNGADGEKYTVVKTTKEGKSTAASLISSTAATYTLKSGEYLTVTGLSKNDTYTVTEIESGTDGYTTTGEVKTATAKTHTTTSTTVEVINDKQKVVITGVVMHVAPYALMLVLAGGFAAVYFTKKRRASK